MSYSHFHGSSFQERIEFNMLVDKSIRWHKLNGSHLMVRWVRPAGRPSCLSMRSSSSHDRISTIITSISDGSSHHKAARTSEPAQWTDIVPLWLAIASCVFIIFFSLYTWIYGKNKTLKDRSTAVVPRRAVSPAKAWAEKAFDFNESKPLETTARLLICTRQGQSTSNSFLGEGRMEDFISTLVIRYSSIPHSPRCTGIKIDYPEVGACLLYLEGEASNLCALLRELDDQQAELHGLSPCDTRVIVYEPESSSRFLTEFYEAKVMTEKKPTASAIRQSYPTPDQPLSLEERLIESAEALDLFVRLLASKVESIPEEEDKKEALMDLVGILAMSPPSGQLVMDLSRNEALPPIASFLAEFDVEYLRYKTIVAEEEARGGLADMTLPEVQRLFSLYGAHLKREERTLEELLKPKLGSEPSHLSQFYPPLKKEG